MFKLTWILVLPNIISKKFQFFKCNNGRLIPEFLKCDCNDDCGDWSDEAYCYRNNKDFVSCLGEDSLGPGRCIPRVWLCNGVNDCGNNWDENHCQGFEGEKSFRPKIKMVEEIENPCQDHEFHCSSYGSERECVDEKYVCDSKFKRISLFSVLEFLKFFEYTFRAKMIVAITMTKKIVISSMVVILPWTNRALFHFK